MKNLSRIEPRVVDGIKENFMIIQNQLIILEEQIYYLNRQLVQITSNGQELVTQTRNNVSVSPFSSLTSTKIGIKTRTNMVTIDELETQRLELGKKILEEE